MSHLDFASTTLDWMGTGMGKELALQHLLDLLRIDGVSGAETQVAAFIRERLLAAGVPGAAIVDDGANERSSHGGSAGNLIVRIPGRGALTGQRPLLLSAHMDTVPLCRGARPVLDEARGRIHTDGSTALGGDNRAGCAAILHAVASLLRGSEDHRPLTLVFFAQEEVGLLGSRNLDVGLVGDAEYGINVDGGAPEILSIGATGASSWEADVHGVAAHAGVHPEDGVSAVAAAALALATLHTSGWHGKVEQHGQSGTVNAGKIEGGGATNVVTDRVRVNGEARSHDSAFLKRILETIEDAFNNAAAQVRNADGDTARVEFAASQRYESFRLGEDSPAVAFLSSILRDMDLTPVLRISDGGLDANNLNGSAGIETVTTGAGVHSPHTRREYLVLDEYYAACELLRRAACCRAFPGPGGGPIVARVC